MSEQNTLNLEETGGLDSIEKYKFKPIKGYPMLRWEGMRPYTGTQFYPAQKKEVYGERVDGWINKIFWGDNLQVMSHLLKEFRGSIDLMYFDPPFDSKADYKKKIKLRGKSVQGQHGGFEEKQYTDIWSNDGYLQFMYERLVIARELMSNTGTLYLHCDWHKSHYLRCILDQVFGVDKFLSEVIWRRSTSTGSSKALSNKYPSNHDTILVYTKSSEYTYNRKYKPYDDEYLKRFSHDDNNGRGKYRLSDLNTYSEETFQRLKADNRLVASKKEGGNWNYKRYLSETKGVVVDDVWVEDEDDVWIDINFVNPMAKEGEQYPTQKPEALLRRIIDVSSNPGDIVFDCFMGSGTTQAVSMDMGRKFIGADINLGSVQTTTKRLLNRMEGVIKNPQLDISSGVFYTNLEVYNVNNYDVFRNPVEAKELLLEALEIEGLSGTIYDGEKDGYMVKVMPVNRIATREDLNELISSFPYKVFEQRKEENPVKPVETIMLLCMGHEPDLKAHLEQECGYRLDVKVVDILRDKSNIEFKRDSEANINIDGNELYIESFYPMNLMQKLSMQKESVSNWKELVESILIDWNYDGAAMEPLVLDIPDKDELVSGSYVIPQDAGTIKIKITDLLSESYEEIIKHG